MRKVCLAFVWFAVLCIPVFCADESGIDPDLLAGMKARSIGPAAMSGRIAAIDVVTANPDILYIGASTGGVWKSENSGLTWNPIFDKEPVAAIGEVRIFQPSPDIVWIGTGESSVRNSVSIGNGVYKSLDGGRTWMHLGLDGTERISRIRLHPTNPDIAWVAALGKLWGDGEDRGIYKTTDGGATWEKVLYVDPGTGAADLVIDPENPLKLIAAMWSFRRWPWFFKSGGPGSGLYITYDGGKTWKKKDHFDGLPKGELGRIGLAVSPSNPKIVYALVESKKIGLYRSEDGGETWTPAGEDRRVGNRPFYYADIRVDPFNEDRVYSLWSTVSVSRDGGGSFENLIDFGRVHPDHHALWIDPKDPSHMIDGNDGGIYVSRDMGRSWRFVRTLPLGQYYHIRVDDGLPYNVYGGMQDNGSWRGPAYIWSRGGIRNFMWQELYYGDGFDVVPDPADGMRGYAMSQGGQLSRFDLRTGESRDIKPVSKDDVKLRFNWNAAIAPDPFDKNVLYFGSQFVHRTGDRGETWERISPDLTTDNPEWQKQEESGGLTLDVTTAENFTSLVAIAPSPVKEGVIWAGSDDGRLHLTRNHGKTWISVEKNVPDVPENSWIPHICASPHDADTAFVVFDDHRRSDMAPYLFETTDCGATWKNLIHDPIRGYALVVQQDIVDPDLLFLGTEFGLYISLDRGASWFRWTHGLPTVSVMDLAIQPREHDLVLGTHGRSAYIIDDIRPLRELSADVMNAPLHLFPIPPAQQYKPMRPPSTRSMGTSEFFGENRPYGAMITFCLDDPELPHPDPEKERLRKRETKDESVEAEESAEASDDEENETSKEPEEPEEAEESGESEAKGRGKDGREKGTKVTIEIRDTDDKVISTFDADAFLGVNRVQWDLRTDPFESLEREDRPTRHRERGPEVVPGRYRVKIKFKKYEMESDVEVLADPRYSISPIDRKANFDARVRMGRLRSAAVEATERITDTRDDIKAIIGRLKKAKKKEKKEDASQGTESVETAIPTEPDEDASASKGDEKETGKELPLLKRAQKLVKELDELEKRFRNTNKTQAIIESDNVMTRIYEALSSVGSSWEAPSTLDLRYMERAESALHEAVDAVNGFFTEKIAPFREKVREGGIVFLPVQEPLEIDLDAPAENKESGDGEKKE